MRSFSSLIIGLLIALFVLSSLVMLAISFPKATQKTVDTIPYNEAIIPIIADYIKVVNRSVPAKERTYIAEVILETSVTYKISLSLLVAVINQESHFNTKARSPIGAIGLGQINPQVWLPTLKKANIIQRKSDLYRIRNNLAACAFILRRYLRHSNDVVSEALERYNGLGTRFAKQYVVETLAKQKEFLNFVKAQYKNT